VSVAARDVAGFGTTRTVSIDASATAFPRDFATTAKGDYRVQVVLDRNGDYIFGGRGPGDIVSKVVTVRFPLTFVPSIPLDHVVPPESNQFDTTGITRSRRADCCVARTSSRRAHPIELTHALPRHSSINCSLGADAPRLRPGSPDEIPDRLTMQI
jgi:hypothetical protein